MDGFDSLGAAEIDITSPYYALAQMQKQAEPQAPAPGLSQTAKLAIVVGGVVAGLVGLLLFSRS